MTHAPTTTLPPLPTSADDLTGLGPEHWLALASADPHQAATWLTAAARLGQPDAQVLLGQSLLDSRGVAQDLTMALVWFTKAAQQGHALGMNMAGRCHEEGWGTPQHPDAAARWYAQAALQGLPEARYNLANLLATGKGLPQDQAQALDLYRQATAKGYAKAWAKLGRYHEDGLLVPQDAAEAMRCYQRGAEGGDFRGQFAYAGMLAAQGRRDEALAWLARVPNTATPRYLREAGTLLLQSPDPAFQAIARTMLARAEAAPATV